MMLSILRSAEIVKRENFFYQNQNYSDNLNLQLIQHQGLLNKSLRHSLNDESDTMSFLKTTRGS